MSMRISVVTSALCLAAGIAAGCVPQDSTGDPTGGGAAGSGGKSQTQSGSGGAPGGSTSSGGAGVSSGSGGATPSGSGTGGVSSTGGASASSGGQSGGLGTGGAAASAGSGGATVGTGGRGSGGTTAGSGGATAGSGGATAGTGGATGSGGATAVKPPVSDTSSTIKIASPGSGYKVEGNIAYGDLPAQRLDVIYPTGGKAGPNGTQTLPGVIMFHGGGWIQGDKATMSSFYSRFLSHGFIVCTAEYRVADGSKNGAIAPAAVQDALLAAKWFWDHFDYYHIDKTKYVVTGGSAGGHLAMMVGMTTPDANLGPTSPTDFSIAAIVNGYGPSDVNDLLKRGTSWAVQWLPTSVANRDALATRLSPLTYVRKDLPPLITVHGSEDATVPLAQSQALDSKLKGVGADAELHIVSGAGHGFGDPASAWSDAEKAMFDFLVKHGIGK